MVERWFRFVGRPRRDVPGIPIRPACSSPQQQYPLWVQIIPARRHVWDDFQPPCCCAKELVASVPEGRLNESMSDVAAYFHCVFGTKERQRRLPPALRERLWPFLGGIARVNHMTALMMGGMEDQGHLLLALPATLPITIAMHLIKGGSSKWIHETFPGGEHAARLCSSE